MFLIREKVVSRFLKPRNDNYWTVPTTKIRRYFTIFPNKSDVLKTTVYSAVNEQNLPNFFQIAQYSASFQNSYTVSSTRNFGNPFQVLFSIDIKSFLVFNNLASIYLASFIHNPRYPILALVAFRPVAVKLKGGRHSAVDIYISFNCKTIVTIFCNKKIRFFVCFHSDIITVSFSAGK